MRLRKLNNKAKVFFYPGDPKLQGHDKGNPDGEAAVAAEEDFLQNYKAAKKEVEEDKNK